MSLQLIASPEDQNLMNELRIDMEENSEPELDPKECCIYRVPKMLRNVNEKAYTPQMVSIGPLHHENKKLAKMEKVKRSYMKFFFERIAIEKRYDTLRFVKNNETRIRNCYSEMFNLKSHKYIMMILYDAIFIIELFLRNYEKPSDSFLSIIAIRSILMSDLELFENQLPYFVLQEIWRLAFGDKPTFKDISYSFFENYVSSALTKSISEFSIKHFTNWRRSTLLGKYVRSFGSLWNEGQIWDLPYAMKLHESGVKFRKIESEGLLSFEKHELHLPHLQIVDQSECIFRNVMALEQCLYPRHTHICNYVYLMDCLIDTENDVDLLAESGIIYNGLGDKSSVANMFNKLCRNITVSESYYYEIGVKVKNHCNNPWKKKVATLRRVYFSDLWRGTGTIAAIILLVLTVMQTICSILQVV